jgi:collagenase-like PrtC family protease
MATRRGHTDWSTQERLEADLRAFREMGLSLDVLFNSNCYGKRAVSCSLEAQVASVLERLEDVAGGADAVTTTSPAVARAVKASFPRTEVRASVNMRIGTVQGMRYLADLFDGFHVRKELVRDLARLRELKAWAGSAGTRLYALANSGCLAYCSGQTFHDNMVAHEAEIAETANVPGWNPHVCWNFLRTRDNWPALLQATWIRPEDVARYEGLFPVMKLATRMHSRPRAVIHAYASGRHRGNLLDLFEPGHGPALAPFIIDNERFPADWFDRTSACGRACHLSASAQAGECSYCADVLEEVAVCVA